MHDFYVTEWEILHPLYQGDSEKGIDGFIYIDRDFIPPLYQTEGTFA